MKCVYVVNVSQEPGKETPLALPAMVFTSPSRIMPMKEEAEGPDYSGLGDAGPGEAEKPYLMPRMDFRRGAK